MCYFDANATTSVPDAVKVEMCRTANLGNPSAEYGSAEICTKIIDMFRRQCLRVAAAEGFRVVVTSGGSESLCTFIRGCVESWRARRRTPPTIVCSRIEHKAVIACVERLVEIGDARVRWVEPTDLGMIRPEAVRAELAECAGNCALVCVMAANNETGAINNTQGIGAICARAKVPYLCDTVQAIGKVPFVPPPGVSAFVVSLHKVHGPKGVGALLVRESVLARLDFRGIIHGSQNGGLRGGTENVPGIAGGVVALERLSARQILADGAEFSRIRGIILRQLQKSVRVSSLDDFLEDAPKRGLKPALEVVVLTPGVVADGLVLPSDAPEQALALPNTLLLSIVARKTPACNSKIRKMLAARGFIVSVGSACNTSSKDASHVLKAMEMPPLILRGVLRVSLETSCANEKNARAFAHALLEIIGVFA
jgi:cysteine desulfurase